LAQYRGFFSFSLSADFPGVLVPYPQGMINAQQQKLRRAYLRLVVAARELAAAESQYLSAGKQKPRRPRKAGSGREAAGGRQ